jgi:hypothetical protein
MIRMTFQAIPDVPGRNVEVVAPLDHGLGQRGRARSQGESHDNKYSEALDLQHQRRSGTLGESHDLSNKPTGGKPGPVMIAHPKDTLYMLKMDDDEESDDEDSESDDPSPDGETDPETGGSGGGGGGGGAILP